MSTAEPTPTPPAPPTSGIAPAKEIRIYSHSSLFYWWPVWVVGFFFALWTTLEGNRLAIVPGDSTVVVANNNDGKKIATIYLTGDGHQMKENLRDASESEKTDFAKSNQNINGEVQKLKPRISHKPWMGPLFVFLLCLVIIITNVPLRGLWSLVTIISFVVLALIVSLFGWWDSIFNALDGLHIYINLAGYLFISTFLCVAWFVSVYIFDKRSYIIFTAGQIKVCEQVGGREKVYDTTGMTIEKQRDDWFRHIFLGFGSGDMSVRTAGADRHEIVMPNVSFIGFKIGPIEQLLRQKQVAK
jgi:hypothetical protein